MSSFSLYVCLSERQNHARELVKEADLSQWDALVIMSGDGLLYEVKICTRSSVCGVFIRPPAFLSQFISYVSEKYLDLNHGKFKIPVKVTNKIKVMAN